ncbi:hypothetical protein BO99DRAFT_404674 [Aspergillus violaceofuscus CBS 115571]|uniref:Uncharacterized protein n=1 Tax=Aspergillus violaceofuscus (strain CBS 115571) TaxID=1450538 RepID=A0A2V5HL86_ASPV1|nr:hypothetical protein BO99DRAFT_404674 [Aspergillus violaceofuscus CBS 115571]
MLSRTSSQQSGVTELPIPDEWKTLLRGLLEKGIKVTVQDVQRVWQLAVGRANQIEGLTSRTLWIETGKAGPGGSGIQHILEQHSKEFSKYEPQRLLELAEASTSVGLRVGSEGKGTRTRPVFGLFFYGEPVAIAVQVGSNGFIVSMNPVTLAKVVKKNPHHGSVNELVAILQRSHSWPIV